MSRSQRVKGASWERAVAAMFRDVYPDAEIRRNLQTQGGRAVGNDLVVPGWAIECKAGKLPNPRAALEQAERDARPGNVPVAIVKDDRQPPFVVLRLAAFLELLKEGRGK